MILHPCATDGSVGVNDSSISANTNKSMVRQFQPISSQPFQPLFLTWREDGGVGHGRGGGHVVQDVSRSSPLPPSGARGQQQLLGGQRGLGQVGHGRKRNVLPRDSTVLIVFVGVKSVKNEFSLIFSVSHSADIVFRVFPPKIARR